MKYFCETAFKDKIHFFISELKPKNKEIKAFAFDADSIIYNELQENISICNSLKTSYNTLYVYMMLSELCIDKNAKDYFDKKASELACKHLRQ